MVKKIWIYEYKDDKTPIGATLIRKPLDEFIEENSNVNKGFELPHLDSNWHWEIIILDERIEE